MSTIKVLWGTKKGAPKWMEQLITEREDRIPAAMKWAKAQGFDRLRIGKVDLSLPPDFISTVRVRRSKTGHKAHMRRLR